MFEGRVALVTGGAHGIGLVTAQRFAEMGAVVVLSDIDAESGEAAAKELRNNGHQCRFVATDVSDLAAVDQLFDSIEQHEGRLDFAFNNAGVEGRPSPVDSLDVDEWRRVLSINLDSVFYCMRREIPMLREAGGGVIINNASIAGLVGVGGAPAYVASKHALIGLTRTAALDLARESIRVNAICPGAIDTPMVDRAVSGNPQARQMIEEMQPIGRLGRPEEVASAVVWMCSPDAAFVTGVAFPIDGAWTAR